MTCTLVVNIPFVIGRCDFYGRALSPNTPPAKKQAYLQALLGEARAVAGDLEGEVDELVFANGALGTIDAGEFRPFMRELAAVIPFAEGCIASAEVDPGLVSSALAGELKMSGVRTLRFHYLTSSAIESDRLGIPASLVEMQKTARVMESAGFSGFDMQLLVGLKGQTEKSLLKSLRDALLQKGVVHCTLLPVKGELAMDALEAGRLLDAAIPFLEEHGFARYAPLCFAKEGHAIPAEQARHTERACVALGPATTSQAGGWVWSNTADLDVYIKAKGDPRHVTAAAFELDEAMLRARALVGGLYRLREVARAELSPAESVAVDELAGAGLLAATSDGAGVALTSAGCLSFEDVSRRIMQTLA